MQGTLKQRSEIVVALLGDASEPLFAAAAVVSRYGADPVSHLPAVFELSRVNDGRRSGGRSQGPTPHTSMHRYA
jgi:hypothetical protein